MNLKEVCESLEKGEEIIFISYNHKGNFFKKISLINLITESKALAKELKRKGYEIHVKGKGKTYK